MALDGVRRGRVARARTAGRTSEDGAGVDGDAGVSLRQQEREGKRKRSHGGRGPVNRKVKKRRRKEAVHGPSLRA